MTDLSPGAQAIWKAFAAADEPQKGLAHALRAMEDHLVQDRPAPMSLDLERAVLYERIRLFRSIFSIAAELDGGAQ